MKEDKELLVKILEDLAQNSGCTVQWSELYSNNVMIGHLKKTMIRQSDGYIKDIVIGDINLRYDNKYFTLRDTDSINKPYGGSWQEPRSHNNSKIPDWSIIDLHDPEIQQKFDQAIKNCVSTVNKRFTGGRKSRKKQTWQ